MAELVTFNAVPLSTNGKIGRRKSDVAILGVPFDLGSTRSAGQREAPAAIRFVDSFANDGARSLIYGVDPFDVMEVVDAGDVQFSTGDFDGAMKAIREQVATLYANTNRGVVLIGGDHSITAESVAAIAAKEGPLTIFHFDAHPDYWHPDKGMALDHGTWVRWVLDNNHANRVVQFGVRGWGVPQGDVNWALKNDVTMYPATVPNMKRALEEELNDSSDPIYLSVDLDVLDPAFAPGVVFQEPGGMTSRELLSMIHTVASSGKMVGCDVTELVPHKDISDITTKIAHRCVMAMLTGLATTLH